MTKILNPLFISWSLVAIAMALLWLRQLKTQNANAVDVAWSLGFLSPAVVGAVYFCQAPSGNFWRPILVAVMVGLWSLRLGGYLFITRVLKAKDEDGRYRRLRDEKGWGAKSFFVMYQFQALLVAVLSIPILSVMAIPRPAFGLYDAFAVVLWLIAIGGESLSDFQLHRFKKNPISRGKTCQVGLWRYSRHPNYFFEWLHWWSYVVLALGTSGLWFALIGPIVMLWFLIKVTGLPATEAQARKTRADYAEYQKTTSAFVPWFRKQ